MREKVLAKFKNTRRRDGYTVYELIIVMVILALLAVILIPMVVDNIRMAKESAEIAQTQTAGRQSGLVAVFGPCLAVSFRYSAVAAALFGLLKLFPSQDELAESVSGVRGI